MPSDILRKGTGRIARQLIASQVALSCAFDKLLPRSFRVDGAKDFKQQIVPNYLRPGLVVYDIGGGARPCVDLETKRRLGLTLAGVDIDGEQFAKATRGLYDRAIVADITTYQEQNAADLVVCKSTLEHVRDTEAALATMARLLNPGGTLLVFVPSRNALFAQLNVLLPQRLKLRLLSAFMPNQADHLGFPAFYDHCTPYDFRRFAARYGLQIKSSGLLYQFLFLRRVPRILPLAHLDTCLSGDGAGTRCRVLALIARKPERPAYEASG